MRGRLVMEGSVGVCLFSGWRAPEEMLITNTGMLLEYLIKFELCVYVCNVVVNVGGSMSGSAAQTFHGSHLTYLIILLSSNNGTMRNKSVLVTLLTNVQQYFYGFWEPKFLSGAAQADQGSSPAPMEPRFSETSTSVSTRHQSTLVSVARGKYLRRTRLTCIPGQIVQGAIPRKNGP
ncbi:5283_t:CDS:2 [Acaulospora colombiana]|uniref:5283_t:CDS:1 n=1 Tax=Acaulospora colombiana TaxID=27376 RepID=A0ACA9P0B0_9GLOM|nr:5283_t:CDS:2 [Acaulospora colombiana]